MGVFRAPVYSTHFTYKGLCNSLDDFVKISTLQRTKRVCSRDHALVYEYGSGKNSLNSLCLVLVLHNTVLSSVCTGCPRDQSSTLPSSVPWCTVKASLCPCLWSGQSHLTTHCWKQRRGPNLCVCSGTTLLRESHKARHTFTQAKHQNTK